MTLTALEIKNAKPGMHSDGKGLYLHVGAAGTASWIFRYQLHRRRREMGIGSLSTTPAVEARAKAAALKAKIALGTDPLEDKRAAQQAAAEGVKASAADKALKLATFRTAAERHIAGKESGWSNPKHRQQWVNTLEKYAHPVIGDMPVRDIRPDHVLDVLMPIWAAKPETASRVRMRIEAVLNSAKLFGWREGENPALWRGGLEAALPPKAKVKKVRHHPALPWRDAAAFMDKLRRREGIAARALEFAILTAARSGEVRHAQWADLKDDVWIVPAERMKARREHRVALSDAAQSLLHQMPRISGCPYIFPGMRGQPLSDMSLGAVLKRMEVANVTVHGFRSTFRDWAAEHTDHDRDLVEMALAHSVGSKVEAAYRRGDMLPKRFKLMADWAAWCGL